MASVEERLRQVGQTVIFEERLQDAAARATARLVKSVLDRLPRKLTPLDEEQLAYISSEWRTVLLEEIETDLRDIMEVAWETEGLDPADFPEEVLRTQLSAIQVELAAGGLFAGVPEAVLENFKIALRDGALLGWTPERKYRELQFLLRLGEGVLSSSELKQLDRYEAEARKLEREAIEALGGDKDLLTEAEVQRRPALARAYEKRDGLRERARRAETDPRLTALNDVLKDENSTEAERREARRELKRLGGNRYRSPMEARAARIGRTIATDSREAARLQAAIEDGLEFKRWRATFDLRTRRTHARADDQCQPIGQPFDVGGFNLMRPGDKSMGAPIREWIQCRCYAAYSTIPCDGDDPFEGIEGPPTPAQFRPSQGDD